MLGASDARGPGSAQFHRLKFVHKAWDCDPGSVDMTKTRPPQAIATANGERNDAAREKEIGEFASPACLMHEVDAAYMGGHATRESEPSAKIREAPQGKARARSLRS